MIETGSSGPDDPAVVAELLHFEEPSSYCSLDSCGEDKIDFGDGSGASARNTEKHSCIRSS